MTGTPELVTAVRSAKQYLTYVSAGPFQYAVAEALALPDTCFDAFRADMLAKRDLIAAGLTEAGFGVLRPAGTHFTTADIRPLGETDGEAFCPALPQRAGVVAIPTSAFHDRKEAGAPGGQRRVTEPDGATAGPGGAPLGGGGPWLLGSANAPAVRGRREAEGLEAVIEAPGTTARARFSFPRFPSGAFGFLRALVHPASPRQVGGGGPDGRWKGECSYLRTMVLRRLSSSAAVLALTVAVSPSAAAAPPMPHPSPVEQFLQHGADALRDAGVTGVSVRLETPRGAATARSGVGDLVGGRPVPEDGYLRLGSVTKTFVATVLLQLVDEERLALDQTVERLLPGVVTGAGNDGRTITLRDLLQHTSGLYDYTADVFPDPGVETYYARRWHAYRPDQLVAMAMRHEPVFPPGTDWEYSNTNYVLAGMVIESVTGRSWEQQVRERILRPLGMRHTDIPGPRPFLPQPHAANHQQFAPDGPMVDTTIPYRPFDLGADGAMTGTARDLNRFFTTLARGRPLEPATLATMRTTVPMPEDSGHPVGTRSGLGLFFTPLSCGGGHLGHGGSGFGYLVRAATTTDGRRSITVSVHSRPGDPDTAARQENLLRDLVDRALCRPA
ncbi:aminotransferase class I/II-fold pyridoxal phosphate-dependent enzyme [Streptomyces sp. NBRC 110035]|uniref:aminotransferase class I/II-fold pyridoxal phosphate-dependent enzyme n=2 Tax=Streptomyces TaxID=1883 RepID=UPI000A68B438|nr:aminotransferase class I/II-fold pyridoxal phosphate-dependent enzyme [Streptomyces sp. NBRC 110035]